jgi:hypothetical protein
VVVLNGELRRSLYEFLQYQSQVTKVSGLFVSIYMLDVSSFPSIDELIPGPSSKDIFSPFCLLRHQPSNTTIGARASADATAAT